MVKRILIADGDVQMVNAVKTLLENVGYETVSTNDPKEVIELARKDWQVIIRPHPHSFKHEPDLINKLQRQSANIPNVVWDTKLSPVEAMSRAILMISDTSSVRFDFAFIYERPVLSLEIPAENMPGFERMI